MTTPADLEANRGGGLTAQQALWLKSASVQLEQRAKSRAFYFVRDPFIYGGLACGALLELFKVSSRLAQWVPFLVYMFGVVAIVIVRVRHDRARSRLIAAEADRGQVSSVSGTLNRFRYYYRENTGTADRLYRVVVGETTLQSWGPAADSAARLKNKRVRAYYLSESKFLVSIEADAGSPSTDAG